MDQVTQLLFGTIFVLFGRYICRESIANFFARKPPHKLMGGWSIEGKGWRKNGYGEKTGMEELFVLILVVNNVITSENKHLGSLLGKKYFFTKLYQESHVGLPKIR